MSMSIHSESERRLVRDAVIATILGMLTFSIWPRSAAGQSARASLPTIPSVPTEGASGLAVAG